MPDRPNFPIPENIHAELQCLQLMIPNDPTWKSVVAGLLYELQYWFNWQRDEAHSGKECASVWKDIYSSIDWSTMSCCCPDQIPTQYRWTEDGELQSSNDGGETWEDSPDNDPRNNSTQYPPIDGIDGDDKKCVAASGMVALIEEQIGNNLTDEMTRYTLQQLISDWVNVFIQTSNIFTALITIATNQIFALTIAVIRPALTEEVYEQLKCIFYCNMANDASFNNAQWSDVREQISDEIGGVAGIFLEHLVYLLGSVGLTNLARSYGATEGDCSECDCPEPCAQHWFVSDVVPGYGPYYGVIIEQTDTSVTLQCHTPIPPGLVNYYGQIQTTSLSDCCFLNSIDVLEGDAATAYLTCGDGGAPGFGLGPVNTCVWTLQPQSTIPFTLKFNFGECP